MDIIRLVYNQAWTLPGLDITLPGLNVTGLLYYKAWIAVIADVVREIADIDIRLSTT